jgi:molybdopterin synthase catalytic subunit
MAIRVLYFAGARDAAGIHEETLPGATTSVADLRSALARARPGLARILPRCRIAVDQEFVEDGAQVRDGAEVAVVPPVAGGAPARVGLVERPLTLSEVVDAVAGPGSGGVVTFTGNVRDRTHGRRVLRLEYEAYRPMAERTLAAIADAIGTELGATVAILHRVGVLLPGEAAVVIACAAAHRSAAFRACEACLERLKRDAPIWKREVFEDGSEWVGLGP